MSKERQRRHRALRDPDGVKSRAKSSTYRAKNGDACRQANREWYAENRESVRDRRLVRKYGLTAQEFDRLLESQGNCCAICFVDMPGGQGKVFHVDHCHSTGRVRGILCHACNKGLGIFKDNPVLLRHAAHYLERG